MTSEPFDLPKLTQELAGKNPRTVLRRALALFERIAISFSGAEDVVLIDMAHKIRSDIPVFTLDTGRLHPETYQFIETVRKHYQLNLTVLSPETDAVQQLVQDKGLFSFYEDGHQECCQIRKVAPLHRQLKTLDAWITGQRKDQSDATRQSLAEVEQDTSLIAMDGTTRIKFNPLVNWTSSQVWDYIEAYRIPFNPLHSRGFKSIGCEPCTRPTRPHQPEREGRWWWEDASKKECGLHAVNPQ